MKQYSFKYLFIIPLIIVIIIQCRFFYFGIKYKVFHQDKKACENFRDYAFKQMTFEEQLFYKKNQYYLNYINTQNMDTLIRYSIKIDSMYISHKMKKINP